MSLHKNFKKVKKPASLVKGMVGGGYFRKDDDEKFEALQKLAEGLSEIYNVPAPEIKRGSVGGSAFACYYIIEQVICLKKLSVVSFLHEFRHHLQHAGNVRVIGDDIEYDAQSWACSVYAKACPGLFKKAATRGQIMGVSTNDVAI